MYILGIESLFKAAGRIMLSISIYINCAIIIFSESSRDCHLPSVQTAHISSPPEGGCH